MHSFSARLLLLLTLVSFSDLLERRFAMHYAGTKGGGYEDGRGAAARFRSMDSVAVDNLGNVFVADTGNHVIRTITPDGDVTTLAGLGGQFGAADGDGTAARFYYPHGIAVDQVGNLYVADSFNHTIRKVTRRGFVSTLAGSPGVQGGRDGTGPKARFSFPFGIACDGAGNIFVADQRNCTIRKVTADGIVTTVAGVTRLRGDADGRGAAARFGQPRGVVADDGGNLYVADTDNHTIRKITPDGVTSTLAGRAGSAGNADGTQDVARFRNPMGVATDHQGNVYVGDTDNHAIRKISRGVVTTIAGSGEFGSIDGRGTSARFYNPIGLTVDARGNVYVSDYHNHAIRKITPAGVVATFAGLPPGARARSLLASLRVVAPVVAIAFVIIAVWAWTRRGVTES